MTHSDRENDSHDSAADSAHSPADDHRRDSIFDDSSDGGIKSDPAVSESEPPQSPDTGLVGSTIPVEPIPPQSAEATGGDAQTPAPTGLDHLFPRSDSAIAADEHPLAGFDGGEIRATLGSVRPIAAAPDRSFLWIVFLATYAATTTAALIYLTVRMRGSGGSQLESLPDVKPLKLGEFRQVRPGAMLPWGHTLTLGDTTRFGNILVEPLRVTRGPLHFSHYDGDPLKTRTPTAPVLKLWLRVTNVADDQAISPLDDELLFSRRVSPDGEVLANNFVCRAQDQSAGKSLVFLFDQPVSSQWNLDGVTVDQSLNPGESLETFLPTAEEGSADLRGDLVWRLHLRKGYSPAGYGVTTLVEVAFSSRDIEAEQADHAG